MLINIIVNRPSLPVALTVDKLTIREKIIMIKIMITIILKVTIVILLILKNGYVPGFLFLDISF